MDKKSKEIAIILLSGGMDSLVTCAIAHEQHETLALLHLNYGQNTESKELQCFHNIADFYNVPHNMRQVIDISFFRQIGGSSLTDNSIAVKNHSSESTEIPGLVRI